MASIPQDWVHLRKDETNGLLEEAWILSVLSVTVPGGLFLWWYQPYETEDKPHGLAEIEPRKEMSSCVGTVSSALKTLFWSDGQTTTVTSGKWGSHWL